MPRTPTRTTTNDEPATVPAVVTPRRADWSDWSADYERRRLESEAEARAQFEQNPAALYPRELAARAAADIAKQCVPDWRMVRKEHGTAYRHILHEQPEVQLREVKTIDRLMTMISDALPPHFQPLLRDARTIYDLQAVAREAAAFLIGIETGRALERQHVDPQGRLRTRTNRAPARQEPSAGLRLHCGSADEARNTSARQDRP